MAYSDKERQRKYQRDWRTNRREAFFADKSCEVCGSTERLELDHIDPSTKLYNPAALWGMSTDNPKGSRN